MKALVEPHRETRVIGQTLILWPAILALVTNLFFVSSAQVSASEGRFVSLQEATVSSEFIFQGTVTSKQERMGSGGTPFTYFTFNIISIIKGVYNTSTIELGFMGGTVSGRHMEVTGLKMPTVGERGIYFVESLQRQQVSPLYGWSQGHYIVKKNVTGSVVRYEVESAGGAPGTVTKVAAPIALDQFMMLLNGYLGR